MLRQIMEFGAVAEHLIGVVYEELAELYDDGSAHRTTLTRLAREENAHAQALESLKDVIPEEKLHYDAEQVLAGQARFMTDVMEILTTVRSPVIEPEPLLQRLSELEGSLADNLFLHFKLVVEGDIKPVVERLAKDSALHGEQISALLSPVE